MYISQKKENIVRRKTMQNKSFLGYTIIVVVALLYALVCGTLAQPPRGSPGIDVFPQETLAAHNDARAYLKVGPMVWNETLAAYAQSIANKRIDDCAVVLSGGPYGENIAVGSNPDTDMRGPVATRYWLDEWQWYVYETNKCLGVCDDYTQIVWRDSVRMGCGSVRCQNNTFIWIACSYDPPGNIPGQLPY